MLVERWAISVCGVRVTISCMMVRKHECESDAETGDASAIMWVCGWRIFSLTTYCDRRSVDGVFCIAVSIIDNKCSGECVA